MKAFYSLLASTCLSLSSLSHAGIIDFGSASKYTMASASLNDNQGNMSLGSAAHIFGNVAASQELYLADGVIVDGNACGRDIQVDSGHQVSVGGAQGNCETFDQLAQDIASASNQAQKLNGIDLGNINSSTLIDASMGSIFDVNMLFLGGGHSLTLSGSSTDTFLFNVFGHAALASGSNILLTGGLKAENVVFNFVASDVARSFEIGGVNISGTFLSDGRSFILGDGATLDATRFYTTNFIQANVQDVSYPHDVAKPPAPTPVNEPSSIWLLLLAGTMLIGSNRLVRIS